MGPAGSGAAAGSRHGDVVEDSLQEVVGGEPLSVGFVADEDAMAHDVAGEALDVVRRHEVAAGEQGVATGGADQCDRGARAGPQFQERGAVVYGVSADNVRSHQKFATKYGLTFPLLSDPDHRVAEAYGSWGPKTYMGRTYEGILRNTFLIDEHGKIARVWEKVKPQGHADEVLAALG